MSKDLSKDQAPYDGSTPLKNNNHEHFAFLFGVEKETFGNATQSYAVAYDKTITDKKQYATCRANGNRLLTFADIMKRIDFFISELVMNDATVDAELAYVISQKGDLGAKMRGIAEYNKLKARITEKREVKVEGEMTFANVKFVGGDENK